MRNATLSRLFRAALASSGRPLDATGPTLRFPPSLTRAVSNLEGQGITYGLNWALAGRGVVVKDRAFYNLKKSELLKNGATSIESLSGIPLYMRGCTVGGAPEISKSQFGKLLKQVSSRISSVSDIFVQDGTIGSNPKCDAKVRVISDNPSAILSISDIFWEAPSRAISHDTCPLTVYIAGSMSSSARDILGIGSQASNGFAAADVERSSLVICGKAFADANAIKDALRALAAPIICTRGGLPLSARLIMSAESMILLFAPERTIQCFSELHKVLASMDSGVTLSSHGAAPFFRTKDSSASDVLKKPTSAIFVIADSTGVFPSVSKLSPGQAAYHFLAGYQDGKFVPAYIKGPSPIDPLELAKALFLQFEENEIPSFLINVNDGGKHVPGKELLKMVESTLSDKLPESKPNAADSKVRDLKGKFKSFLSGKFHELPEQFFL